MWTSRRSLALSRRKNTEATPSSRLPPPSQTCVLLFGWERQRARAGGLVSLPRRNRNHARGKPRLWRLAICSTVRNVSRHARDLRNTP
jgi:hypothetical protein